MRSILPEWSRVIESFATTLMITDVGPVLWMWQNMGSQGAGVIECLVTVLTLIRLLTCNKIYAPDYYYPISNVTKVCSPKLTLQTSRFPLLLFTSYVQDQWAARGYTYNLIHSQSNSRDMTSLWTLLQQNATKALWHMMQQNRYLCRNDEKTTTYFTQIRLALLSRGYTAVQLPFCELTGVPHI